MDAVDAFGELATLDVNPTIQAGRYRFQADAERRILGDILPKLALQAEHRVLDIGFGAGALLIPLSYMAKEVVGIEHPGAVEMLKKRHQRPNVTLVEGSFPTDADLGQFDRILIYSVLPCMPDYDTAVSFVLEAAALLAPGGRLLVGDVPNRDRAARWRAGEAGVAAEHMWDKLKATLPNDDEYVRARDVLASAKQIGGYSDEQIAHLCMTVRAAGYEAYWLPQSPDLPFGNTREDLLITRY